MRKEYDFSKAELVIPPKDPKKTRITIRLDTKILKWFWERVNEAGGGNYQTMINEALKSYIESHTSNIIPYPGIKRSSYSQGGARPMKKGDDTRKVSRDAGTGKFVSPDFAKKNPKTTVTETVKKTKKT
jgi:hypothetical protein